MKSLRNSMILGTIFVLIIGTLSHFFYEWSGYNPLIGIFTPVNESTWEHMKLLFFPMLLSSFPIIKKQKQNFPCIQSSLALGILIGTFLIPIIFYSYSGFLGYNLLILDILTFFISVILAFYIAYKLTLSCCTINYTSILSLLLIFMVVCFVIFTYYPPDLGLFSIPSK